ncbi:MAG: hypothetical protein EAS48_10665 [Chryseobacterium sp.]|nr:MAG: hypothetical protein EAS48_10665 [Chryseobacterium sp.]
MSETTLLILAGGLGSRFKGSKQTEALTNKAETLMDFALYDAVRAGIGKFVFVVNDRFPTAVRQALTELLQAQNCRIDFVTQNLTKEIPQEFHSKTTTRRKPLGTAHAVLCARNVIDGPFITLNADDFYGRETFKIAADFIANGGVTAERYAMAGFRLENTLSENGGVSRGICKVEDGKLLSVEEYTGIEKRNGEIVGKSPKDEREILDGEIAVSMNFWLLHPSFFAQAEKELTKFLQSDSYSPASEFYLPTVINNAMQRESARVTVLNTSAKWFGLTFRDDKELASAQLQNLKNEGVYPQELWQNEKAFVKS